MTRHKNMNTSLSIFIHLCRVEFSFALRFFFCRQKTKIKRKRGARNISVIFAVMCVCVCMCKKKNVQLKMSFGSSTYNTLKVLMTLSTRKLTRCFSCCVLSLATAAGVASHCVCDNYFFLLLDGPRSNVWDIPKVIIVNCNRS